MTSFLQRVVLYLSVCIHFHLTLSQELTPTVDVKVLSELPIDRLLQVKKSLIHINGATTNENFNEDHPIEDHDKPSALALKKSDIRRDYEDEKGYSIQSIFQTSVTALAFLAFGGYLVCLITQSIKGHGQDPNQVIVMESLVKRPLRIKGQRPNRYRNSKKRRPNHRIRRDIWPNVDPEKLYEALIMLSEGYTKHHINNNNKYKVKTEL